LHKKSGSPLDTGCRLAEAKPLAVEAALLAAWLTAWLTARLTALAGFVLAALLLLTGLVLAALLLLAGLVLPALLRVAWILLAMLRIVLLVRHRVALRDFEGSGLRMDPAQNEQRTNGAEVPQLAPATITNRLIFKR